MSEQETVEAIIEEHERDDIQQMMATLRCGRCDEPFGGSGPLPQRFTCDVCGAVNVVKP